MKLSLFISFFFCLNVWGGLLQAQSRINIAIHTKPPQITTAVDSANLFENKYVDPSLIRLLQNPKVTRVSIADSLQVEQIVLEVRRMIGVFGRLNRERRENTDDEKLALLREANSMLEKGLRIKPSDEQLIRYSKIMSNVYESLLKKAEDYPSLVQEATQQLCLNEPEKHFKILFSLGDAYSRMDEYELSRHAYNRAVESLFEFYEDSLSEESYKNYLYRSLVGRGTAEEKLYLSSAALRSWQHVLFLAPEEQKENIELKISRTLLWDDGNLIAFKKRNEAMALFGEKKYPEAKRQFLELLPSLYTYQARAEINRLLAQIEFTFLDDAESGLERMHRIIIEYPKFVPMSDSVADSTYLVHQQTYAQLCHFQGVREMRMNRTREAFIYFAKAAEFESKLQASANFYLAALLSRDRNSVMHSEKIVSFGLKAWDGDLNDAYRRNLANMISSAYQQQGKIEESIVWKTRYLELN